tara:strand:+ start:199 stop:1395 length:1197 start_codon:yes stop_codon:yes gene_type:complete
MKKYFSKIIFITQNKLTKRDYTRFGFNIFMDRGYKVDYWDITPVLRSFYHENFTDPDLFKYNKTKIFYESNEIIKSLKNLKKSDLVISLIKPDVKSKLIFEVMNELKIHYGFINNTDHPENSNNKLMKKLTLINSIETIKNSPLSFFTKIIKKISRKFVDNTIKLNPFFVMVSGQNSFDKCKQKFKNSELIKTHALDYDIYLDNLINKPSEEFYMKDYAVFIDNNLPFSIDHSWGRDKPVPWCNPDDYFSEINKFLDLFTMSTKLNVIIAAHPRSNYNENVFDKRKTIKNKTSELIKHSKCVLMHQSTSTNFAVLYRKPIIFLNSSLFDLKFRTRIKFLSNYFGDEAINLSKNYLIPDDYQIKSNKFYKSYINKYIKMNDSSEKKSWDILCDYLDSLK